MGEFMREQLPEPIAYYEGHGLVLQGRGKWRTSRCEFHGGSDSLRIQTDTGAFVCMACNAKGGDVLAYHRAAHGLEFVDAAKALGAYREDGNAYTGSTRPTAIPARALLQVIGFEALVASMVACDLAAGRPVSALDKQRLLAATGRIQHIAEVANA
jgi:hypothetical protein